MTTISKVMDLDEAMKAVHNAQSIVVVSHISPDGDAVGSLLGITNALRLIGKNVHCAIDDGIPDFLMFVPGADTILPVLDNGTWDLFVSVDASDEERTGESGAYARANSEVVINLDHHMTNTMFGDVFLVDPEAVSATEIAFYWLKHMRVELTPEIAIPLLTGLVTDTLGFRTSNVSANTLGIAQELISVGASLTEITERTLDNKSFPVVNLWKNALASVELYEGGVISVNITQSDLKRAGLVEITDGGLVGFLIRVNEATIAVVFKETDNGEITLSLRAKPGFNVSDVAFNLGGGGHKQASGATISGTLDEVRKQVIPLLMQAAKNGKLQIV